MRVFFNPCPSFPMVPVGTDLLECKQPWITVGSLFPLHKATKPWEQPFIQLVIIRVYNTVTATQPNGNCTSHPKPSEVFKEQSLCFCSVLSQFGSCSSLWSTELVIAVSPISRGPADHDGLSGRVQHNMPFCYPLKFSQFCVDVVTNKWELKFAAKKVERALWSDPTHKHKTLRFDIHSHVLVQNTEGLF